MARKRDRNLSVPRGGRVHDLLEGILTACETSSVLLQHQITQKLGRLCFENSQCDVLAGYVSLLEGENNTLLSVLDLLWPDDTR